MPLLSNKRRWNRRWAASDHGIIYSWLNNYVPMDKTCSPSNSRNRELAVELIHVFSWVLPPVLGLDAWVFSLHRSSSEDIKEQVKREKERCSGSYCQAVVFLVIKHDSISERPGYWQWGSRYTAHAGRNLPVKEFCYLRTNLLTAAVREEEERFVGPKERERIML